MPRSSARSASRRSPSPARGAPAPGAPLTIGDVARAAETKAETIRYYERIGLLPEPERTSSRYRQYGPADVQRLRFVRRARDLGFTLEQVRALVAMADEPGADCAAVDRTARLHLAEVEEKIAQLGALRSELRRIIARCGGGTTGDCRILEALGEGGR